MPKPFISLTSDFGVQSQGVGIMHGVALSIAPEANVIHLMHGLPAFDVIAAARTMETVKDLPVGYHVCVCDPGVGTSRRALICQTMRGDYLIGPDNGVLLPAARKLGGVKEVRSITNESYMRLPVSPIFHGRDIFAPSAAHLATGVPFETFGPQVATSELVAAPYEEAILSGKTIKARIIQINHFGSIHLNVSHELWDSLALDQRRSIQADLPGGRAVHLKVGQTFGDVPKGENLILKDDYSRVAIAKNMGSFVKEHPLVIGDDVTIHI